MKNIIVDDYFHAVAEVKRSVYAILDRLPHETKNDFFRLESDFGFRCHFSWTRGYTCVRFSGDVSPYLGRYGIGWFCDETGTTRFSLRTYCYIPLTLSDFIHPVMNRRGVLRFISNAERFGDVTVNRDFYGKPSFGSLTPETRAYLARNVAFGGGAYAYNSIWRGYVQSYVVNLSALEPFCVALDEQLFTADTAF